MLIIMPFELPQGHSLAPLYKVSQILCQICLSTWTFLPCVLHIVIFSEHHLHDLYVSPLFPPILP